MNGTAPIADYSALVDLAGRIHQHLANHPRDPQALKDLHYVVMQLQGQPKGTGATQAANDQDMADVTGPQTSHPIAAVGSGLMDTGIDLLKNLPNMIRPTAQVLGQVTGAGNIARTDSVMHDPEASLAEKLDAAARGTPLNMGYALERGLLNATGAKSDTPASVRDQAHAAGNVASLALLGVKPSVAARLPLKVLRGGASRLITPLLRSLLTEPAAPRGTQAAPIASPEAAPLGTPEEMAVAKQLGLSLDQVRGRVGTRRAGLLQPSLAPSPKPAPDPLDIPTFMRQTTALRPENPQGLLAPTQAAERIMGKPGHPLWSGEGSPTRSPEVRGGEPLLPSANPAVAAMLQQTPFAKLQATLRLPETPQVVKNLILIEIQRRGIVGPGLLAPR